MYTDQNFKTGKDLRVAVVAFLLAEAAGQQGRAVTFFQPGMGLGGDKSNGTFTVEGPHAPKPHAFYVQCVARNNRIVWCNGLPVECNPNSPKYNQAVGIQKLRAKFPDIAAKYSATPV